MECYYFQCFSLGFSPKELVIIISPTPPPHPPPKVAAEIMLRPIGVQKGTPASHLTPQAQEPAECNDCMRISTTPLKKQGRVFLHQLGMP